MMLLILLSAAALVVAASCRVSSGLPDKKRMQPAFQPKERVYNYAPCLVEDAPGRSRHVFYCANREPGQVTDYLCHRKAKRVNRAWVWGKEVVALAPSPRPAWDSRHVCDPETVSGRYRYRGKTWAYAMFYLGCDAENCTHNQVGVAFADSLDGPWTRYPDPLVRYTEGPDTGPVGEALGWPIYRYWGVGQPAAISLDKAGKTLLFYTRGEAVHAQEMVTVDLSDMDAGPQVSIPIRVPSAGLRHVNGQPLHHPINIAIAYEPSGDRFYMAREGNLPPDDERFPGFISAFVQVAWIAGDDLRAGRGTWRVIDNVGPETTGWPRNHNPTLLKDLWGRVRAGTPLTLGLSVAESFATPPPDFAWLWTYRIVLHDLPVR